MSTTNVIDANISPDGSPDGGHGPGMATTTATAIRPADINTIDLTTDSAPRTRVATIDLSAFGAPLELAPSGTDGELFRLAMGTRSIHVVDATHTLIPALFEIEVDAVANGRDVGEFHAWLADTEGAFFAVIAETSRDAMLVLSEVRSFARLTLHPRCDRGLRELGRLLGRHPEDIINDFRDRSGLANLDGLIDVTTFTIAPQASRSVRQYAEELGFLIDGVATALMVMAGRGEACVVTTSLARAEQRWLFEAGWPLADCLDADLAEVLLGSRSRAGRSIPAWFRLHGLWGAVASQRTISLGNVATHLHRNRIELGSCIPRTRGPR